MKLSMSTSRDLLESGLRGCTPGCARPQARIAESSASRAKIVKKQGKLKRERMTYEVCEQTLLWEFRQSAEGPNAPQVPLCTMYRSIM